MPDLLQSSQSHEASLEGRLHSLYANDSQKVILHLEQLIYSHQHAQVNRDELALQDITHNMLWWLGYGVNIHADNAKIFVIDDTIENLKLVTTLLTKAGYDTECALNGRLALAKIPLIKPSLILLDIKLPDIDGYQVYKALQASATTADIPVVFLSSVDTIQTVKNQHQHRVGYLSKPFKPHSLLNCVSRYLQSNSNSDALTNSMVSGEIKNRQRYAQQLPSSFIENHHDHDYLYEPPDTASPYFFRATLDGRYLRVSEAFAQLCGYDSSEDIISSVTNLWEQIYKNAAYKEQWRLCLQYPNQFRVFSTTVRTPKNPTLEIVEKISLIQDSYNHNLFYHGYIFV
ncbi:MAG: response regulator [Phormidesmis sp.]